MFVGLFGKVPYMAHSAQVVRLLDQPFLHARQNAFWKWRTTGIDAMLSQWTFNTFSTASLFITQHVRLHDIVVTWREAFPFSGAGEDQPPLPQWRGKKLHPISIHHHHHHHHLPQDSWSPHPADPTCHVMPSPYQYHLSRCLAPGPSARASHQVGGGIPSFKQLSVTQ